MGKKVMRKDINENRTFYRSNIPNGMYLYQLIYENKMIESGKIIFE
jgi:hypothetical protein